MTIGFQMSAANSPEAASRIEPPAGTRDKPKYSSTVEEFFFHRLKAGRPICVPNSGMQVGRLW